MVKLCGPNRSRWSYRNALLRVNCFILDPLGVEATPGYIVAVLGPVVCPAGTGVLLFFLPAVETWKDKSHAARYTAPIYRRPGQYG